MTPPGAAELRFNALNDAWLPLVQGSGATIWASPVEVLCGEKDGVDLDYPRDDFRIFARLLLSALVQALFAAQTKAELIQRLQTPLSRSEVEARIAPVLADFDLFGPRPFMQVLLSASQPDHGAAPFVFPSEDLFRSATPIDALSVRVALVMLFTEEAYAGGAGRGYGAGPAGQLGTLTLIDPGTVRTAAWANTLTVERAAGMYAPDGARPWGNEKRGPVPRASLGLVTGLFFQPRAIWLLPAEEGECSFDGSVGPRVRRSPFLSKSELTSKPKGGEDLWQHPCAPLAVNSQGIAPVRLSPSRPAWTGLAQLLRPLSKGGKKTHPREGPAPVLQQWKTLGLNKRPNLLVLDFDRDKATVRRRFFESFPLTDHLLGNDDTIERLRALVVDAQEVRLALARGLTRAHDDRRHGGLAMADAESAFWSASEAPFLDWLACTLRAEDGSEAAEREADDARATMLTALRGGAMRIFDAHVQMSEFDPGKQARVATARRGLIRALFPKTDRPAATPPAPELTP